MTIQVEDIRKALATVQEPDLKQDLVSLGMIKDIVVQGNEVSFTVVLTTPACPLKEKIRQDCEDAIHQINANLVIQITMTANVNTLRTSTPVMPQVKNIIAIASGKGGVGKSTVTANLAVALAQTGAKVGVIDADIFGPSIPTMFNCETAQPGVIKRGDRNVIMPVEQYGIKLLSIGFLTPADGAIVWRGPMASSAFRQFMIDAEWGELDYMLIDMPPGTSDIHLTLVQTVAVTGVVIVTTPQKVALADAQKGLAMFTQKQINVPILGVIENMAYFTPAELPNNKYYIFGKDGGKVLAGRNDVSFLGEVPLVQSIREAGDNGKPIAMTSEVVANAFAGVAQNLAQAIALRNLAMPTQKVEFTVHSHPNY